MKGILLVGFGTSYKETRKKTLDKILEVYESFYKEVCICQAYTSKKVIEKIKLNEQIQKMTVEEGLESLVQNKCKDIVLQSLHLIPGVEYEKMVKATEKYRDHFNSIKIGRPLLYDEADLSEVKDIVYETYNTQNKNEAILLVGHGSYHHQNKVYDSFKSLLKKPYYFMTLDNDLEEIIHELNPQIKKIHVIPFMLVAGDHAQKDMNLDIREALEAQGFKVQVHLNGLGELEAIQNKYMEHTIKAR